jgi:hypothetical protein
MNFITGPLSVPYGTVGDLKSWGTNSTSSHNMVLFAGATLLRPEAGLGR